MKVLHVSTARTWRGGEQQIAWLVEELQKLGVAQKLVCVRDSAMEEYCIQMGLDYVSLKKHLAVDPLFAVALKKVSNQFKPDIMHVHDAHAHTFAVLSRELFNNKVPVVLSRRVDFKPGSNWFSTFKYNHRSIRKIICVSDKIKEIISESIRDRSKLVTVHSGIDVGRFKKGASVLRDTYKIREDTMLIGNVAALAPHKDYPTFLKAVEILRDRIDAKYFIIGEGELRTVIEEEIIKRQLQDHVILTGFRNDVESILPELNIFLTTSKTEGLGTSILDAFAAEVPVVATRAGGMPEIVTHEITGLLAPVGNAGELAAQVIRLTGDPVLKDKIVANAKIKVQDFSKEVMARKTLQVYEDVCREII